MFDSATDTSAGLVLLALGIALCGFGARALRLAAFCCGFGVAMAVSGALGASVGVSLLFGLCGAVAGALGVGLLLGAGLPFVGALAGGVIAATWVRSLHPLGHGGGVTVSVILAVALLCGLGVLYFVRPLLRILTAVGGAGLILQGVVVSGPDAASWLRHPGTAVGSVFSTVIWAALAVAGWLIQRRGTDQRDTRRPRRRVSL